MKILIDKTGDIETYYEDGKFYKIKNGKRIEGKVIGITKHYIKVLFEEDLMRSVIWVRRRMLHSCLRNRQLS